MTRERLDTVRTRLREDALRRGLNPRDVDLLLSDVTGQPLTYLLGHGDVTIDPASIEESLARRHAGEPLQYIRGRTEFYGHDFIVDDRVLIPRPETELLVDAAIERAPRGASLVDIGTGSGCIAISIALERPDLHITAVDASVAALAVANRNRIRLGTEIDLASSDVLDAMRTPFDVIVSNPPYIPADVVEGLEREVRDHEPRMALTPGTAGLEIIERIFAAAGKSLVLMEIGYGQAASVREVAKKHDRRIEAIIDDLAGIPRVVVSSGA